MFHPLRRNSGDNLRNRSSANGPSGATSSSSGGPEGFGPPRHPFVVLLDPGAAALD
jgi:hypothetical protein